jgi:phosphatidylglycerophosphate synthase
MLARLPLHPNHITLISFVTGLIGAILLIFKGYLYGILGTFLILMSNWIDNCDGEIARLRFQTSTVGEWLDTICDDIIKNLLLIGLYIHLFHQSNLAWLGLAGLSIALIGQNTYLAIVYRYLIKVARSGNSFAFHWWFDRDRPEAAGRNYKPLKKGPFGKTMVILRLLSRHEFFVFLFFILSLAGALSMAFWLSVLGASVILALSIVHIVKTHSKDIFARNWIDTFQNT